MAFLVVPIDLIPDFMAPRLGSCRGPARAAFDLVITGRDHLDATERTDNEGQLS